MDAHISSLNFEQPLETPEKGVEGNNEFPQSTSSLGKEVGTEINTGEENAAPSTPPEIHDERDKVIPQRDVVAGDSNTRLADFTERIYLDEVEKNNLPNEST